MRVVYTTLIGTRELASVGAGPSCTIVDCRFDLARPQWGEEAYREGHVPGAVYAHLDRDLSGPVTPSSGRHPLPDPECFAATVRGWGIGAGVQVVAYDQANGAYASRLWWMLRWLGHRTVAVLDGGYAAWQENGLPVAHGIESRPSGGFVALSGTPPVSTAELERALRVGSVALVDARAADRFAGRNETLDAVAGHVPGAINHPFARNLGADGRFLAAEELRARWLRTLGARPPGEAVCMCGSGVTACHNLLALEIAQLTGARLYAGSWSEWIQDPARPVSTPQS
jgi:thiosulfate/3-mercaptopyruvate sulfurtransferase